jgi:hypothetical protein
MLRKRLANYRHKLKYTASPTFIQDRIDIKNKKMDNK